MRIEVDLEPEDAIYYCSVAGQYGVGSPGVFRTVMKVDLDTMDRVYVERCLNCGLTPGEHDVQRYIPVGEVERTDLP